MRFNFETLAFQDLLSVIFEQRLQLVQKEAYARDLETYIDNSLVNVIETTPTTLEKSTANGSSPKKRG